MKMVVAIIKPFKLDDVRDALIEFGIQGITVMEVQGFGRQKGHSEFYQGSEYHIDYLPKTRIELVIPDDWVNEVVALIMDAGRTGMIGDGKIFVTSVEQAWRIRTGEQDENALL